MTNAEGKFHEIAMGKRRASDETLAFFASPEGRKMKEKSHAEINEWLKAEAAGKPSTQARGDARARTILSKT